MAGSKQYSISVQKLAALLWGVEDLPLLARFLLCPNNPNWILNSLPSMTACSCSLTMCSPQRLVLTLETYRTRNPHLGKKSTIGAINILQTQREVLGDRGQLYYMALEVLKRNYGQTKIGQSCCVGPRRSNCSRLIYLSSTILFFATFIILP